MSAETEGESGSEQSAAGDAGSPSRRRHAVFISDFVHLEYSFDEVSPALVNPDGEWRGVAAGSGARQHFEVIIGEPRRKDSSVIIPMRWEPVAFERLPDPPLHLGQQGRDRVGPRAAFSGPQARQA